MHRSPRLLALTISVLGVVALAACQGDEDTVDTTTTAIPVTATRPAPVTTTTSTTTPQPVSTTTRPPLTPLDAAMTADGRNLVLDDGAVQVVFDTEWGGAIREIRYQGENLVNNYDGGRLIAVSLYDGATTEGTEPGDTGWNPTPSDAYNHRNQPIDTSFADGRLSIESRYIQWYPTNKGGGPGASVPTDVVVETEAEFVVDRGLLHLTYRITYDGNEPHLVAHQEFPFAYIRRPFDRFVTYGGAAPWSDDAVSVVSDIPVFPATGDAKASEEWAGLVDDRDVGVVMYAPQNYDGFIYNYFANPGPAENSCYYLLPHAFLELTPGLTKQIEVFLYAGKWQDGRRLFESLHDSYPLPDVLPPVGTVDTPSSGAVPQGMIEVSGWVFDNMRVAAVTVLVDGEQMGTGTYGLDRPDVADANPTIGGALHAGFIYELATAQLAAGDHVIEVEAVDDAGNAAILAPGEIPISVGN